MTEKLQTVVVTGAKGALGSTVAERFLQAGCTVVGVDLGLGNDGKPFADTERDNLHWIEINLSEAQAVRDGVAAIADEVGPIDAVVNCAGGFRWTLIGDAKDEDIDFLIDANLRSALLLVREVVPGMKERDYGRVVLISSKSTLNPGTGEGPYAATKAALNALTKSVAAEVAELDVTINAVLPSIIDTPANREEMPDADHDKWVKREQLAELIYSLTQSVGEPINGALIPVSART
ncbi:SDR family NAD(P)-dependent oxidoreductase [Persicimonas caeni]|uniref:SDR family NAD(P)-dependent oxidoreductase n=1 Tax=Persicimonas caeni TaxID=2292766 RepID=A0A4Y6PZK3_PERCE|nr:SDR family NAD(P)-dependent oxidoreductase [Persicimonas caeni]QDG53702.1 SDR family NAD(P)-dependent oxidoreductase [Persicimonas caeni]QED34923.1 SDR family NAD(P)-dependent oxidoreductase [Persicimonas caeni]